jgi:hypothetical protein
MPNNKRSKTEGNLKMYLYDPDIFIFYWHLISFPFSGYSICITLISAHKKEPEMFGFLLKVGIYKKIMTMPTSFICKKELFRYSRKKTSCPFFLALKAKKVYYFKENKLSYFSLRILLFFAINDAIFWKEK